MKSQTHKQTETRLSGLVATLFIFAMLVFTQPANAAMNESEARQWIESEFGVTVLDVRAITDNGRRILAIKIMNPQGNRNGAFLVSTIAFDPETGMLVSQYRQKISGAQLAAPPVSRRTSPLTAETP